MGREGTKAEYTCLLLSMSVAFPPQPIHSAFARAFFFFLASLLPCLFPLDAWACTAPVIPVAPRPRSWAFCNHCYDAVLSTAQGLLAPPWAQVQYGGEERRA